MDEVFKKRHATRNFLKKKVSKKYIKAILEAANSAPSAGNLKARKIILVENQAVKEKLVSKLSQSFIKDAPLVLVFCAAPSMSSQKFGEKGEKLYSIQDATISASFAWIQAVMLGLSACWVGSINEENIKLLLNLEKDLKPIAIMPIGYAG